MSFKALYYKELCLYTSYPAFHIKKVAKMKIKPKETLYLDTNLFQLRSYKYSGISFKNEFHRFNIENQKYKNQVIQNLELYIYDDYSGIITYLGNDKSKLKSGYIIDENTIAGVTDQVLYEFSNCLFSYKKDKHEILYLIPHRVVEWQLENMKMFGNEEIIRIEECDIEILTIYIKDISASKSNAHIILSDIHDFIENSELSFDDQICYDVLLNESIYLNKALVEIIESQKSEILDDLIFNESRNSWFSWYIAKIYMSTIKLPINKYDLYFINKMINHSEMLNDYWKDKLKLKYINNAG